MKKNTKKRFCKAGVFTLVLFFVFQGLTSIVAASDFGLSISEGYGTPEDVEDDGGRRCFVLQRGRYYWTYVPLPLRHAYGCFSRLWLVPGDGYRFARVDVEGEIKFIDDSEIHAFEDHTSLEWDHLEQFYAITWEIYTRNEYITKVEYIRMSIDVDIDGYGTIHKEKIVNGNHLFGNAQGMAQAMNAGNMDGLSQL